MKDLVLTLEETAAILKVSMDTMYQLVKIKDFPATKIGGWKVKADRLGPWIDQRINDKEEFR